MYDNLRKLALEHIYITGIPGTGKTTEANRLSKELNLPVYHLDEIPELARKDVYKHIAALADPHIIEGVQLLNQLPKGDVRVLDDDDEILIQRLINRGPHSPFPWVDKRGRPLNKAEIKEKARHIIKRFREKGR